MGTPGGATARTHRDASDDYESNRRQSAHERESAGDPQTLKEVDDVSLGCHRVRPGATSRIGLGARLVIPHAGAARLNAHGLGRRSPDLLAWEVTGMQTAPRACRLGRRFQSPSLSGEVALLRPAEARHLSYHGMPELSKIQWGRLVLTQSCGG